MWYVSYMDVNYANHWLSEIICFRNVQVCWDIMPCWRVTYWDWKDHNTFTFSVEQSKHSGLSLLGLPDPEDKATTTFQSLSKYLCNIPKDLNLEVHYIPLLWKWYIFIFV
jgi:hypothetical protein